EEKLGTRVNNNRTEEALATGAGRIAVGCPFCNVMLADGLTEKQSETSAHENVEVVDVAQMLLAPVRRPPGQEERVGRAPQGKVATRPWPNGTARVCSQMRAVLVASPVV